ncbi:MAG: MotA/TolQ/ExbB proton channel family protein [bacterium]
MNRIFSSIKEKLFHSNRSKPISEQEISEYYTYAYRAANINVMYAIIWSIILMILSYSFTWLVHIKLEWVQGITDMFVSRGIIPYLTTFCFWLGISNLVLKRKKIQIEESGFKYESDIFAGAKDQITLEDANNVIEKIKEISAEGRKRIIVNRIERALRRMINTKSASDVDNILNSLSEIDSNVTESSYSMIRYLVWIIPTLGFIGTVMGIGKAIGGFAKVIEKTQDSVNIIPHLPDIALNLGIAFDTTLVALGMSVILVLIMSSIQKREEDLLSSIDDFCMAKVVNRLTNRADPSTQAVIDAIKDSNSEVITALENAFEGHKFAFERIMEDNRKGMAEDINEKTNEMLKDLLNKAGKIPREYSEIDESKVTKEFKEIVQRLETIVRAHENLAKSAPVVKDVVKLERVLTENQNILTQLQQILKEQSKVMNSSFQIMEASTDFFKKNQEVMEQLYSVIQKLSEKGIPINIIPGGQLG